MAKPASDWADDLASRGRGINLYVRRMDRLFSDGTIPRSDIERVYAGAFLAFHTYLESSIERLFVGLLVGRFVSQYSMIRPLVTVRADRVAYHIVRGERSYAAWLPYERYTLRRAKAFFSRGKPFTDLKRSQIKALDQLTTLRNALAHDSDSARRAFRATFTDGKTLPPDQLRPSGYLRGLHAVGQTRFDLLLSDTVRTARVLAR